MQDLSSIFLLQADPKDEPWESYHTNTKLNAWLMPPASKTSTDPVAELNAAVRKTAIEEMEAAIGSGGKRYPTAPSLILPRTPHPSMQRPTAEVMAARASQRAFDPRQLSLDEIATLCLFTAGENDQRTRVGDSPVPFRYSPSAGALFPLELYLLVLVPLSDGISPSCAEVWHYDPRRHALERIHRCAQGQIAACFQTWPDSPPPLVALFTGVPKRQSWKYGARAYRYTLLEAGHAVQNLTLAASALDLGSCPIVGFYDDALHDLLDIDGVSEIALYSAFLGHPSTSNPSIP